MRCSVLTFILRQLKPLSIFACAHYRRNYLKALVVVVMNVKTEHRIKKKKYPFKRPMTLVQVKKELAGVRGTSGSGKGMPKPMLP